MICFYHKDSDGKCAGFWIRKLLTVYDPYYPEQKFIQIDYKDRFPLEIIRVAEQVIIVDFSIPPDLMCKVLELTSDVLWIDHHKTAIEKYEGFEHDIPGLRYIGYSGAMLTYCYLREMSCGGVKKPIPFDPLMTIDAPLFTKLIDDWDVWRLEYGDYTKNFQTGFQAYDFSPESENWDLLYQDLEFTKRIIEEGKTITKYKDEWNKNYLKAYGFPVDFEGYKAFAMNIGLCNSEFFKSLEDEYDLLMPFAFDGKQFSISMYSNKMDVSKIAKKYNGGGHAGAAGFQCEKLPFEASM